MVNALSVTPVPTAKEGATPGANALQTFWHALGQGLAAVPLYLTAVRGVGTGMIEFLLY